MLFTIEKTAVGKADEPAQKGKQSLGLFFAVAYLVSWTIFGLLALNHHQIINLFPDDAGHARWQDALHSLGAFGPFLAVLITLKGFHNRHTRGQYWKGFQLRKLTPAVVALALSPLILLLIAAATKKLFTGEQYNPVAYLWTINVNKTENLLLWLMPSLFFGFGEEAGWRGFALPLLQKKHSTFIAASILCVFWFLWHLPVFFYRYNFDVATIIGYAFSLFAGSVWLCFLFNFSKGSVLAVGTWHALFNIVSMLAKNEPLINAVMSTVIILMAVFVLIRFKGQRLSPHSKVTFEDEGQTVVN